MTRSFKWRHSFGLILLLSLSNIASLLWFSKIRSFVWIDSILNRCCCCLYQTDCDCGKAVCKIYIDLESCLALLKVWLIPMTYSLNSFKSIAPLISCLYFSAWRLLCQTNKIAGFSCLLTLYFLHLTIRFQTYLKLNHWVQFINF